MLGGLVAQVVCEGGLLVVGVGFVVTPAIVLKVNCDDDPVDFLFRLVILPIGGGCVGAV